MNKFNSHTFQIVGAEYLTEHLIFKTHHGDHWTSNESLTEFQAGNTMSVSEKELELITFDLYPWSH